ncbi:endolytic transglycosylase MltG [Alkalicoccus urumqiensis]|uniref:Endolytic murein transglycosylase n=2 Tax=Alkalicoccus urumqiensis TaxID=1548213 RepID=A0A2P6MFS9_ALKUR|nr:endolytic transglycosylase MltG [Alkalicoccus urumqiensis]
MKREKYRQKIERRKREAGAVRKIVFTIFAVVLLTLTAVAFGSYQYVTASLGPKEEASSETIEVEVPIGSNVDSIAELLEEEGVIDSAMMFRLYVRFQSESGFQAGTYELSPSMGADDIIAQLKEGRVYEEFVLSFTIPEGWWIEEMAHRIAAETEVTAVEFMETARNQDFVVQMINRYPMLSEEVLDEDIRYPLEGYLFPARYDFTEEDVTAQEIMTAMLDRMQEEVSAAIGPESETSPHELLTKASIIEAESAGDDERETVSGVIDNRLDVSMQLQMDPTAVYAHGERKSRVLNEDLEIDSPYNTYQNGGLPIGPISNPGAASIQAAASPEDHNYLYFYHSPNGDSYFNETLAEHNEDVGRYQ